MIIDLKGNPVRNEQETSHSDVATGNGSIHEELVGIRIMAVRVEVLTSENRLRYVGLTAKQSHKLMGYIQHQLHGGRLKLSKEYKEVAEVKPA